MSECQHLKHDSDEFKGLLADIKSLLEPMFSVVHQWHDHKTVIIYGVENTTTARVFCSATWATDPPREFKITLASLAGDPHTLYQIEEA